MVVQYSKCHLNVILPATVKPRFSEGPRNYRNMFFVFVFVFVFFFFSICFVIFGAKYMFVIWNLSNYSFFLLLV